MATFVSRSEWGARNRRSSNPNITPQNGGVSAHHVDAVKVARSNHAECAGQVQGIQNFHMDDRGWTDIAYSHLVCIHGYVFEGRGEGERTAANGTNPGNQNWYAVCALTGGTANDYDPITDELIDAYHLAITRLRDQGGAASAINGHRDHLATTCPGDLIYARVQNGDLDPGGGGDPGPPSWPGVTFQQPPAVNHPSVGTWQGELNSSHGYSLVVDSSYGPLSEEACRSFQTNQGLVVDGIVGPITWDATFA